jgi:hypothetical protein
VSITPHPITPCGSYTISWSNGANSTTINGLTAGIYYVNVTDNCSGLTVFDITVVNEPDPISSFITVTDVKCRGEATGQLDLSVTGGTPGPAPNFYQFTWTPTAATTEDLINVTAGTYSVLIRDANGCTGTKTATIKQPAQQLSSSFTKTDASCAFKADGSVNLTVWGGVAPYVYDWDNGFSSSEDVNNLAAGPHMVEIYDANNCLQTENIVINEPPLLTSSITGTHVKCFGNSDGSIDLTVNGGTPPYDYNWTSTQFTLGNVQDLNNVPADSYNVTITDKKNCTTTNNFTINEPSVLQATIDGVNVSCFGFSDGNIDLSPSGGSPPYTFSWSNNAGALPFTSEDLNNIPAETYTVIVSDTNNCTLSRQIVITQPLSPITTDISSVNVRCFGGNDGSADLTVLGGTPPYDYLWSNNDSVQDLTNLFSGNYSVTVVDDNGCTETDNVFINQPLAPLSSNVGIEAVSCYGFSDGNVQLFNAGGTPPYNYQWTNSKVSLSVSTPNLINYPAEHYYLTITDSNNCVLRDTAIIPEPPALSTNLIGTAILCFGDSTGAIDLSVNGGITPYRYNWSNSAITEDLINLPAGKYLISVSDSNNCLIQDSIVLEQPLEPLSSFYHIIHATCFGDNDGSISYTAEGGTTPYRYNWSSGQKLPKLFDLTAGTYVITTTDGHNCELTDSIFVNQPGLITIDHTTNAVSCFGLEDGSINIDVTGGTPSYRYSWTNSAFVLSATTEDLVNRPSDIYTITVTDTNGCQGSKAIPLSQPDLLQATHEIVDVACAGGDNGSIDLTIFGGTTPYTINWSNGATTADIEALSAGKYAYLISDSNLCKTTDTLTITEPLPLSIVYTVSEVSCVDQQDGSIALDVSGGTPGYVYDWSNGGSSAYIDELAGGTYEVTVSDILLCETSTSIEVPVNNEG